MIDLKQKELYIWQQRNFGIDKNNVVHCALGMAEETGELCHHILKGTQKIRGGIGGIDKAMVADSIADCLIYGIQICSNLGLDAEAEIAAVINKVLKRDWKKDPEGKNHG